MTNAGASEARTMTKVLDQHHGQMFTMYHGDCVEVNKGIPDSSIDYRIMSPPFAQLYAYSASTRDMGNSRNYNEFFSQYRYLIREQLRTMKPGRLMSIHCMLLPTSKQYHGYIGLRDFRGDLIREYLGGDALTLYQAAVDLRERARQAQIESDTRRELRLSDAADVIEEDLCSHPGDSGFIFHSEVCIDKDPVVQMHRTKSLGLLHKQLKKDSAMSRQGLADYLVTFRKPGTNPDPIAHTTEEFPVELWQVEANPTWNYGEDDPAFKQFADYLCKFFPNPDTLPLWLRYPEPVWRDINQSETLQCRSAREYQDERHIAPLQLEVIRRGIRLWSRSGDVVMSDFAGIGSELVCAIEMGRRAIGAELKASYYRQAVRNCQAAEQKAHQPTLFDLLDAA